MLLKGWLSDNQAFFSLKMEMNSLSFTVNSAILVPEQ